MESRNLWALSAIRPGLAGLWGGFGWPLTLTGQATSTLGRFRANSTGGFNWVLSYGG
jgi:hypothetical protein